MTRKKAEERLSTIKIDFDGYKLTLKEREIATALAMRSFTGETVQDIADHYEITTAGIYGIIRNNPDFKRFQNELSQQLFDDMVEESKFVVRELLREKSPSIRLKAAELVFKSSGMLKSEHTVKVEQPQTPKTLDELEWEQAERERRIIELEKELLD